MKNLNTIIHGQDLTQLKMFTDPGHGWLEVPMRLIKALSIENKISSCSYRNGRFAYLEEDCDLSVFIRAIGDDLWQSIMNRIPDEHTDSESVVRGYSFYEI